MMFSQSLWENLVFFRPGYYSFAFSAKQPLLLQSMEASSQTSRQNITVPNISMKYLTLVDGKIKPVDVRLLKMKM